MPIHEVEKHPFLDLQEKAKGFSYNSIKTMIVGTFPIYCITSSMPLEKEGEHLKENWTEKANFKFFYGSRENHFWRILSSTFNCALPKTTDEAISIITENGIFISDVYKSTVRNNYSPFDKDLIIKEINAELVTKTELFSNLRSIVFTSRVAKATFCEMARISDSGSIQQSQLNGKKIMLYSLPTPAGNGRSVSFYFNDFPPNQEELAKRNANLPYAVNYRMRIYTEILKL